MRRLLTRGGLASTGASMSGQHIVAPPGGGQTARNHGCCCCAVTRLLQRLSMPGDAPSHANSVRSRTT